MSNNGIGDYFHKAQEAYHQICTVCEAKRSEAVEYVKPYLSQAHGAIVERVSKSASDILIGLCAVSGVLTIPAGIVFAVKKVIPLKGYIDEMLRDGSTKESIAAKWTEIKEGYAADFKEKIGPVLFVVLTVDAVFTITIGALMLNGLLLLHGVVISAPAAYFIYSTLKKELASDTSVVASVPLAHTPLLVQQEQPQVDPTPGNEVATQPQ